LHNLNLKEEDDPYLSSKFVEDLCLWPSVEHGHIFTNFIQRPGVYTQQQLLQWKSMDAYNYFRSGHVRTVEIWAPSNKFCFLKAKVNHSQNSPDNALDSCQARRGSYNSPLYMYGRVRLINIMILLFSTKFIFNYISRLGERCSHVATVLFKIEAAVRNGYTSATSNSCQWNQVYSTKVRLCHVQIYDSDPCITCTVVSRKRAHGRCTLL